MIDSSQIAYQAGVRSGPEFVAVFEDVLVGLFPISDCRIEAVREDATINHIKARAKRELQQSDGRVVIPLEHKFNLVGRLGFRIEGNLSADQLNQLNKIAALIADFIYHTRVCRLLESEVRRQTSRRTFLDGEGHMDQQLVHADRLRSLKQLAGGLAHELNNLLCAIIGTSEFALDSGDAREYKAALKTVVAVAEMAGDIVNKLLKFSGSQMPAKNLAALAEPVNRALAIMTPEIIKRGIKVEKSISESPQLYFDGEMMVQVMLSLIQNALEEMEHGGILSISLGSDREFAVIRLRDSGGGPAATGSPAQADSARIFEPFYSTKGVLAGGRLKSLGLGLSIAHGLIEAHGGEIFAENRVDGSLEFVIRLPLKTIT